MKRFRVLLVLATALVSAVAAVTVFASEQSDAALCTTKCPPPPEEEPPKEENPPPAPKPTPSMLVINVGWNTGVEETSTPLDPTRLPRYVDYLSGKFNEWMAQSAPAGYPTWKVVGGGSYQVPPPPIPASNSCTWDQKHDIFKSVADAAEAKARAQGINPDQYSIVVVGWGKSVCEFGGIRRGRRLGITYPNIMLHEFGHYLGLREHANALVCKNASGALVPLSANCTQREYSDHYDSMGEIPVYSYNAIHANRLEWLKGQLVEVSAGPYTRSWTLKPFTELPHGQRAIRLQDGATTLWLEYRGPVGIDSPEFIGSGVSLVDWGLIIHRETNVEGVPRSELLDMTPGDERGFNDAGLWPGKTWTNPLGTMSITFNSLTKYGATVTISDGRITVPDVRGYTAMRAAEVLEGAGLRAVGWNGIIDPTCNYIGLVAATSPFGGARAFPGSAVTVAIGERDLLNPCQ